MTYNPIRHTLNTILKMHNTIKTTIALAAMTMALYGCGKQHKAESVINDFLAANLQASDYTVSFSDIDSTRYVSDSIVNIMRAEAAKNIMFKKGIKYADKSERYIYTRVTICIGNDTTSHTFYLTPDMSQVVSFKEN